MQSLHVQNTDGGGSFLEQDIRSEVMFSVEVADNVVFAILTILVCIESGDISWVFFRASLLMVSEVVGR